VKTPFAGFLGRGQALTRLRAGAGIVYGSPVPLRRAKARPAPAGESAGAVRPLPPGEGGDPAVAGEPGEGLS
jgi:hypothetical protein